MSFWTLENLKSAMGGAWITRPTEGTVGVEGASIDSRSVAAGQVFFALKGELADGLAYVGAAIAAGSTLAVVEGEPPADAVRAAAGRAAILRVASVKQALARLAAAYRKSLDQTKVIAVGGSNGKTTTTRLIAAGLGATLRGSSSVKSFNNDLGVPLTILNARKTDQFLVCEVGTNAPGEIAPLTEIVRPDIVVITTVGREHLEGLGDVRGVAAEEASLLRGLRPGGLAVLNADSAELGEAAAKELARLERPTVITFGFSDGADLRITAVEHAEAGVRFELNGRQWHQLALVGRHNASNAAAAVAVTRRLSIDPAALDSALAVCAGPEMRLERRRVEVKGGVIDVLNDAYNANPDSMLAAIETFVEVTPNARRRVVVLGDMLELGDSAPDLHREVGEAITRRRGIDTAVLVGPLMLFAAERVRKAWPVERVVPVDAATPEKLATITSLLKAGDAVLLKGSRRMGLERVLTALSPSPAKAKA